MTEEKRPVTLITGASTGIGAAWRTNSPRQPRARADCATRAGAQRSGRRHRGQGRRATDRAAHGCGALRCRARHRRDAVPARARARHLVVNNAGFGLLGAADDLDRAQQLAMIDLNVRAVTDFSLAFVDSLERRKGGILNVASVAGFLPDLGMAVYYATKAFVLSFSEALHHELAPRGVRVTVLCPGPVPAESSARRDRLRHFAAAVHDLGRTGRRRGTSRSGAGAPPGRSGPRQPAGHDARALRAAQYSRGRDRTPTKGRHPLR